MKFHVTRMGFYRLLSLTLSFIMVCAHKAEKRMLSVPSTCNGWPQLCNMTYDNVTFLGAHDSPFTSSQPLALARDQDVSIQEQLDIGVRLIQGQFHHCKNNQSICLCHNPCDQVVTFDAGLALNTLQFLRGWLDDNPNEVLTVLFTNGDFLSINDSIAPVYEESGLAQMAYTPPVWPLPRGGWPTLAELIQNNTRLLIFIDYYEPSFNSNTSVPFIMNEFDVIWENPFTQTTNFFNASVDRISGNLTVPQHMSLMNAIMDIPGIDASYFFAENTLNSFNMLVSEALNVSEKSGGFNPTFVLVDFVDMGNTLQVVNYLNGLGNTSAPNITANDTMSRALSLSRSFGIKAYELGEIRTYLLGSVLLSVLFVFVVA